MKSLKRTSIFIVSILLFTITSCDNEPLEGNFSTDNGGDEVTCAEATQNLAAASDVYATTATDAVNYPVVCNAYAVALQNMISACGDTTGGIQALLDTLDCPVVTNDCVTAQTASDAAETAYNADTTNTTLCNAYQAALQNEITQCGDADGSLQEIIVGLGCEGGTTIESCGGFNMVNVLNQTIDCDYNFFDDLTINKVYIEEIGSFDEDLDGVDEHFLSKIYITDGTANLDASNNFVDFANRTYILTLGLLSEGTTGFVPDLYRQAILTSDTDPHFSTIYSSFYGQDADCESSTEIYCSGSSAVFNGLASITEENGVYSLCFQTLVTLFGNNCFSGTYEGEFIPIVTQ